MSGVAPTTSNVPSPPPVDGQQHIVQQITQLKELIFTRLDAMDRAIVVFNDNLVRVPTDVDKAVGNLKELHDEKFIAIEEKFKIRDTYSDKAAQNVKEAVAQAFSAAKEAVAEQNKSFGLSITKSEETTTKTIDALGTAAIASRSGLEAQLNDLKERLVRAESIAVGRVSQVGDMRATIATAAVIIGMFIAVAGYLASH